MSYNLTGAAYGGNVSLSPAGLTATAASPNYSTANTLTYAVKGQLYSKTAVAAAAYTTDAATNKAFVPLAIGEACIFAFFINAAGTVSVIQGAKVLTNDLNGGLGAAQFPQANDALTPFGYVLVKSDPAAALATWTFGTSNNTGVTGVSTSTRDIMDYPAQPIVA